MRHLVINGHRSKVPFSTWGVLELHQNSFLGSSWDLYGAIKRTGPSRSGKFSLNRHSIGLRKVSSFKAEFIISSKHRALLKGSPSVCFPHRLVCKLKGSLC